MDLEDNAENIIEVVNLKNRLGGRFILNGVNLTIRRGEIAAIIGETGSGKTTLLRSILMLIKPTAGKITVFGNDITQSNEHDAKEIQRRWGVLFQSGALFSSLTVWQNILFPLQTMFHFDRATIEKIVKLKISLVGLDLDSAQKLPSELSGGMKKRVALARAIVLDPELVVLDEPTTGLDPKSAEAIDDLILFLRKDLGITFLMVTHDLDSLWKVPDRIIFLGEGKILADASIKEMVQNPHPLIKSYFSGIRNRQRYSGTKSYGT